MKLEDKHKSITMLVQAMYNVTPFFVSGMEKSSRNGPSTIGYVKCRLKVLP